MATPQRYGLLAAALRLTKVVDDNGGLIMVHFLGAPPDNGDPGKGDCQIAGCHELQDAIRQVIDAARQTCEDCAGTGTIDDPDLAYTLRKAVGAECPTCLGTGQRVPADGHTAASPAPWDVLRTVGPIQSATLDDDMDGYERYMIERADLGWSERTPGGDGGWPE